MSRRMRMFFGDERGITALETAIILIAFVVVASVFAFTMLSAGTFSTEQGRQAVYSGLSQVQGSIELRGSVIAYGNYQSGSTSGSMLITQVVFVLSNVAGGDAVDVTQPTPDASTGLCTSGSSNKVVIDYRDYRQSKQNVGWSLSWVGYHSRDTLLEEGEQAQITVPLSPTLGDHLADQTLQTNTSFAIEVKPPKGAVLLIERTSPAYIDTINDLH